MGVKILGANTLYILFKQIPMASKGLKLGEYMQHLLVNKLQASLEISVFSTLAERVKKKSKKERKLTIPTLMIIFTSSSIGHRHTHTFVVHKSS